MYDELLERIKKYLDLEFYPEYDDILNEFINGFAQFVKLYVVSDVLPTELEFVVIECTIARYRRIGSEGLESEGIADINMTYQEILLPYYPYMDNYKKSFNKIRFL